ncbi:mitochondrial import inner membrane translocase subunit Tim16 [Xylocopa sonorina]|uniref:mitochondrial import inner membrane translocase subunit Tim16 n=1 Tax=Xylocopa sonorina TaxID=1818115 RepID=UPI00403ADCB8
MAKHLVQIIVMGTQVVVKAFARALRQEIAASQAAARKTGGGTRGTQHVAANYKTGLSLEEALQILNVDRVDQLEAIERNYKYLMEANDRSKGGSFYIQSKIVRAKERIDEELKNMKVPPPKTDFTQRETYKQS